jgi:hypothetical protein
MTGISEATPFGRFDALADVAGFAGLLTLIAMGFGISALS